MVDRKTAQRQLRRNLDLTDAQVAAFIGRLSGFLKRSLGDIISRVEDEEVSGQEAAAILGSLTSRLEQAGLTDELAEITRIYGTDLEYLRDTFEQAGVSAFSDADLDLVQTLIDFDVSALQDNVNAYVSDIRGAVMRTVLSGERPDTASIIDEFTSRAVTNAETELRTGLSAFKRTLTLRKAEEVGFTKFLYVGPDDEVTREFCQERVGNTYTMEEIREWDNGQGLPADIYLGGYNCRHDLRPVE